MKGSNASPFTRMIPVKGGPAAGGRIVTVMLQSWPSRMSTDPPLAALYAKQLPIWGSAVAAPAVRVPAPCRTECFAKPPR